MTTYVIRAGQAIEKHLAPPLHEADDAPRLIRDSMDPTWHPADGQIYDSKHKFRAATKAAGCIEVGDQKNFGGRKKVEPLSRDQRASDIKYTIEKLRSAQ